MNDEQPVSLQRLDEAIRSEVRKLLHEAGIYAFGSYGWTDADTPDREFIGHAMWQTDGLSYAYLEYAVFGLEGRKPVPEPDRWLKQVAICGADFEGLMQAAWMAIGLFLFQAKLLRDKIFGDNQFFDLHWMSSIIHLSTASDRLRTLFVEAVFHKSTDDYKKLGKYNSDCRGWYTTPSKEAHDTENHPALALSASFAKLLPMADEIYKLQKTRHQIIHEVATAIGDRQRRLFNDRHWARPRPVRENITYRDIEAAQHAHEVIHEKHITEKIARLTQWYLLLVRASNEVFIIINGLKRAALKT